MKARVKTVLAGVVVVTWILFAAQVTMGASDEELRLVQATWANGVPIPHLEISQGLDWLKLLYDPLFGISPEGALSPEHGLATKWEMSRDGLTWTVQLRKGVKFHDGVEVTAKDAKFSIELAMLPESVSSLSSDLRKTIKQIEVKDPYTLVIQCRKPSMFFPSILSELETTVSLIVPKEYYERVGKDQFMKKPIGSGPYKWHSQVVGSSIKLEATARHWRDGVPRFKYVTFLVIPEESTRIAMLKTGQADIARVGREGMKEILDAGLRIISKKDASTIVFMCAMQWATPAFGDIRFRKALNLAIDKGAIIKNIFGGRATQIAQFPDPNIFACGGDPTLKPYPYDPQEARRLIKEGGYDGYEFMMPSFSRSGVPEFSNVVETVVGYWQKIGLKPKIFVSEYVSYRESWRAKKIQNHVVGTELFTNPECGSLLSRTEEKYGSLESRTILNNPKMDEFYKRANSTLDMAEVVKIMGEIYRYSYDQYLMTPICNVNDEIAITKKVPEWNPGRRRQDRNYNDIIRQR